MMLNIKISKQAQTLIDEMPNLDTYKLKEWFKENYLVIGSAQITEYLMQLKNGN